MTTENTNKQDVNELISNQIIRELRKLKRITPKKLKMVLDSSLEKDKKIFEEDVIRKVFSHVIMTGANIEIENTAKLLQGAGDYLGITSLYLYETGLNNLKEKVRTAGKLLDLLLKYY